MTPTAGPTLGPLHAPSLRDRDRAEARARRNPLVWLREILVIIVVALVISSLLRAFIVQVFWIPSPSMHNTLVEDDRIAVSRIDALTSNVQRGDVVVFDDTLGWLGSSERLRLLFCVGLANSRALSQAVANRLSSSV